MKSVQSGTKALQFDILSKCKQTKARTSIMKLPHFEVELPMFMPVGTQGTMKGLTPNQVMDAGAQIILGNTYHLGTRPGKDVLDLYNGLHDFMAWPRALLTDSGGFQMVSLLKLAKISEEGVKFQSPYDGSECMLTPEESIQIQNSIGADIMMQLDDVVDVQQTEYERFKLATERTTRWLDRCMKANQNPERQNLFAIIQGGLFPDLRRQSLRELIARDASGYAIGGLSGGEDKNQFWSTVNLCTNELPEEKPRYCMGVGFSVDLVVCCALGVDMFDCVYPTRTARFGCALVDGGQINLKNREYRMDFTPIDPQCACSTCRSYTRAYLNSIITRETIGCHLISVHNIHYLMQLMKNIRESIKSGQFVSFVLHFMARFYRDSQYPQWVVDALGSVGISLPEKSEGLKESESSYWNEEESERDYMNKMSGFERFTYTTGFRQGIWKDFDMSQNDGRLRGYEAVDSYSSHFDSTACGTQPSTISTLVRKLAKWEGVFYAYLSSSIDIPIDLKNQVEIHLKRIETLLHHASSPSDETALIFMEARTDDDLQLKNFVKDSLQCINECQQLIKAVSWEYPSSPS